MKWVKEVLTFLYTTGNCGLFRESGVDKDAANIIRKQICQANRTSLQIREKESKCLWLVSLAYSWGPVRTTRNFVSFDKKSVNAKLFLVRTIFCIHQNFFKPNETSKIPSTSFGGCKNFVRRENPLFLVIHPSLGHQISQTNRHRQTFHDILMVNWSSYWHLSLKENSHLHVRTGLRKQKIGDYEIFNFFANA